MHLFLNLKIVLIVLAVFSSQVLAQTAPNVRVAVDSISGLGCSPQDVSAVLTPDSSTLSVMFNNFKTEIEPSPSLTRANIECMVRLKFYFGGRNRIAIIGSDMRGFAAVPESAKSSVSIQHYSPFTNDKKILNKMLYTKQLVGPTQEDLIMESRFADRPLWSWCGTQGGYKGFNLITIHIKINSESSNPLETLLTTIDSLDLNGNASLKYHLTWRADNKNCPK